jgi:quinol-cytochrome oxidoreductase complex cytochrome b subunit
MVSITNRRESRRRPLALALAAVLLISMMVIGIWGYLSNTKTEAADSSAAGMIEGAHLDIASSQAQRDAD